VIRLGLTETLQLLRAQHPGDGKPSRAFGADMSDENWPTAEALKDIREAQDGPVGGFDERPAMASKRKNKHDRQMAVLRQTRVTPHD